MQVGFSAEWSDVYARGEQIVRWPWSDLISACKRHLPALAGMRVIELGCGTGPNIRFFEAEGADYYGVDGSAEAVKTCARANVCVGDFTRRLPELPALDMICDRAAVTHNDTGSTRRCLDLCHDALKPGGFYIGIDWFSSAHWAFKHGTSVDEFTRSHIAEGQFKGVGLVHFSDSPHLMDLFRKFEIVDLSHKVITSCNSADRVFASWNIVARKK